MLSQVNDLEVVDSMLLSVCELERVEARAPLAQPAQIGNKSKEVLVHCSMCTLALDLVYSSGCVRSVGRDFLAAVKQAESVTWSTATWPLLRKRRKCCGIAEGNGAAEIEVVSRADRQVCPVLYLFTRSAARRHLNPASRRKTCFPPLQWLGRDESSLSSWFFVGPQINPQAVIAVASGPVTSVDFVLLPPTEATVNAHIAHVKCCAITGRGQHVCLVAKERRGLRGSQSLRQQRQVEEAEGAQIERKAPGRLQ